MGNFEKLGILVIIVLVVVIIVVAAWGVRPGARTEPLAAGTGDIASNRVSDEDAENQQEARERELDEARRLARLEDDRRDEESRRREAEAERRRRETSPLGATKEYTVKRGDSLWSIAAKMYGKGHLWKAIAKANPSVNPDNLVEGTKLKIPVLESSSGNTVRRDPVPTPDAPGTRTYQLKHGDSLWMIAKRELGNATRYKEILTLNPGLRPERLPRTGTIKIPAR